MKKMTLINILLFSITICLNISAQVQDKCYCLYTSNDAELVFGPATKEQCEKKEKELTAKKGAIDKWYSYTIGICDCKPQQTQQGSTKRVAEPDYNLQALHSTSPANMKPVSSSGGISVAYNTAPKRTPNKSTITIGGAPKNTVRRPVDNSAGKRRKAEKDKQAGRVKDIKPGGIVGSTTESAKYFIDRNQGNVEDVKNSNKSVQRAQNNKGNIQVVSISMNKELTAYRPQTQNKNGYSMPNTAKQRTITPFPKGNENVINNNSSVDDSPLYIHIPSQAKGIILHKEKTLQDNEPCILYEKNPFYQQGSNEQEWIVVGSFKNMNECNTKLKGIEKEKIASQEKLNQISSDIVDGMNSLEENYFHTKKMMASIGEKVETTTLKTGFFPTTQYRIERAPQQEVNADASSKQDISAPTNTQSASQVTQKETSPKGEITVTTPAPPTLRTTPPEHRYGVKSTSEGGAAAGITKIILRNGK